jgi:hypothetical protein
MTHGTAGGIPRTPDGVMVGVSGGDDKQEEAL